MKMKLLVSLLLVSFVALVQAGEITSFVQLWQDSDVTYPAGTNDIYLNSERIDLNDNHSGAMSECLLPPGLLRMDACVNGSHQNFTVEFVVGFTVVAKRHGSGELSAQLWNYARSFCRLRVINQTDLTLFSKREYTPRLSVTTEDIP